MNSLYSDAPSSTYMKSFQSPKNNAPGPNTSPQSARKARTSNPLPQTRDVFGPWWANGVSRRTTARRGSMGEVSERDTTGRTLAQPRLEIARQLLGTGRTSQPNTRRSSESSGRRRRRRIPVGVGGSTGLGRYVASFNTFMAFTDRYISPRRRVLMNGAIPLDYVMGGFPSTRTKRALRIPATDNLLNLMHYMI